MDLHVNETVASLAMLVVAIFGLCRVAHWKAARECWWLSEELGDQRNDAGHGEAYGAGVAFDAEPVQIPDHLQETRHGKQ